MKPDVDWWTIAYISTAGMIIWWGFRRLIKRFDSLITEVQNLSKSMIASNHRIKSLEDYRKVHERRLNSHSEKIRALELKNK